MLVLSRTPRQRVLIRVRGEDVWVELVSIEHGRARLGFTAPRDVVIQREELIDREQVAQQGGTP